MFRPIATAVLAAFALLPVFGGCVEPDAGKRGDPSAAWLSVSIQSVPDGYSSEAYQRMWPGYFLPHSTLQQPAEVEKIKASDEFKFTEARSEIGVYGDGYWKFQNPDAKRWPTRAMRITFPEPSTYKVGVIAYCETSDKGCADWADSLRNMKAPRPDASLNPEIHKQWQELVVHESCSPGPIQMDSPRYPPEALFSGVSGRVVILILANPCGDVRGIWVEKSSRNRDLDRAALSTVKAWRVDLPTEQKQKNIGALVRVPVDFIPPTLHENTPGPVAPGS